MGMKNDKIKKKKAKYRWLVRKAKKNRKCSKGGEKVNQSRAVGKREGVGGDQERKQEHLIQINSSLIIYKY